MEAVLGRQGMSSPRVIPPKKTWGPLKTMVGHVEYLVIFGIPGSFCDESIDAKSTNQGPGIVHG